MSATTNPAAVVHDLLSIVIDGVTPRPTAAALAALQAGLRRQVDVVGLVVAEAAARRLRVTPGPANIAARRAAFAGIAAVLGSAPLAARP